MKHGDVFQSEFEAQLIKSTEEMRHAVRINKGPASVRAEVAKTMVDALEKWLLRAAVLRGFKPREETIKLLAQSFDFDFSVGICVQTEVEPVEKVLPEAYTLFLCDLAEHERRLRLAAEKKLASLGRFIRFFGFRWCTSCGEWIWLRHRCL